MQSNASSKLRLGHEVNASRRASDLVARFAPWFAQGALPFLLVAYLGLRGGGYDAVVRSEVGIAAWWIVMLGALVGVLPIARVTRGAWAALAIAVAFVVWTAVGVAWSESAERSVAEFGRVGALLGVFALAICVQGREGLRRMVGGTATAILLVAAVALASRLHPSWFPELEAPKFLPGIESRLHHPLNYWNGLATFAAIGVPLLLALSTTARSVAGRALALAGVPVLALTAFLTLSRGGALEIVIALAVLFALHPRRLTLLVPALVAGVGSFVLVAAATQRDQLVDGKANALAASQGNEMLAMVLIVCGGVGLIGAAVALAARYEVGPRLNPSRALTSKLGLVVAVCAIVAVIGTGTPAMLSDAWDEFKSPVVDGTTSTERFESFSGAGRYQFWETAIDAGKSEPILGIGPGTYEYYWAKEGELPTFVRDAHSLYLETFAELGIVGFVLIAALVASPFAISARRLFSLGVETRGVLAGALAACAAFAVAAGIDWAWELTVLPVIFLLLTAAIAGVSVKDPARSEKAGRTRGVRLLMPVLALFGLIAVAIPMSSISAVRESEDQLRTQDLSGALSDARRASDIQPYAATPSLQQALVLELQGDLDGALHAARIATQNEPTNWRTWLILSRLEAQAGNPAASVDAYREARSLNPRSVLFQ